MGNNIGRQLSGAFEFLTAAACVLFAAFIVGGLILGLVDLFVS